MSRGIPVQIGTLRFSSKKAANQFFRAILKRYNTPGAPIAQDDDAHLRSLIEYHPRRMEKGLFDIDHFTVYLADGQPGPCFYAVKDGGTSRIHFSFPKCIEYASANPRTDSSIHDLHEACRAAVEQETRAYKEEHITDLILDNETFRCPITGKLHDPSEAVVHHAGIKFRELVDNWLIENGWEANGIPVQRGQSRVGTRLDEPYLSSFRTYHNQHADLQLVSIEGNGYAERGGNHHSKR